MAFSQFDRVKLRNIFPGETNGLGNFNGFIGTIIEGPVSESPFTEIQIYRVALDSGQVIGQEGRVEVKVTEGALLLIESASAGDLEFLDAREKYRELLDA
jgi:hypothetical protein